MQATGTPPPLGRVPQLSRPYLANHQFVRMISPVGARNMSSLFWQRGISSAFSTPWQQILNSFRSVESANAFQSIPKPAVPWNYQQIRPRSRGNEYQPSNIKRKHKHGWIRRIRTASGIEVILRRMLKGRKSLTH